MTSVWGSIPHGNSEFFPCPTLVTRCKNIFFYFFTKLNTYHLSYYIHKYGAIDIADPSSIQDACHMNFVVDFIGTVESLTVESPWLSSRATKRGIWRSEIRFLMGTQNFSFVPRSWQDAKISFSISLPSSKLSISLIPIFEYLVLKREEFVYHEARASDWPICRGFNYHLKWVIRPVNGQNWILLLFNDNILSLRFLQSLLSLFVDRTSNLQSPLFSNFHTLTALIVYANRMEEFISRWVLQSYFFLQ